MNEDKIIEVKEEKVSIVTSVTPNSTEVEEKVEDVVVQVATPLSLEIEDENLIDVEIEEAFPYIVSGVLDKTLGDKDVLIDAGIANVANNDETVGLQEVIEAAAAQGGSGGTVDHSLLNGREFEDQHPITAISGLRDELDDIEAVKRVYSSENGLSEFRKWDDGNPEMENRAGYFVKLVQGTDNIAICTDEDDVYGIAVTHSGFVGNQIQADKSDDPSYSMVGIAGALRVRTDGTARNGEYVVPNELGIATFSTNNCGYKVISQGSYASYQYVTIAVTPQNDKLSKVYGMLTDTSSGGTIGNLIIQIEDIESQIKENNQKVDIIVSDNESIKDILDENQSNIKEVTDISNKALEDAQAAKDSVASAIESANEATRKAQDAALEAQNATKDLADISQLADQMNEVISFEHNGETGMAGVVAAVKENSMVMGDIMTTVDEQGANLAATILKTDENGLAIQNLVSHVDKYSVGEYSVSYGLSFSEAGSILTDEYIYVPTVDHTETMIKDDGSEVIVSFVRGYSYEWDAANVTWVQSKEVSLATTYKDGINEGDLWLCWQDVEQLDENGEVVITYVPGTLYRWDGKWIAVATISDNYQGRIITSVKQTADGVKSDVINLRGDFTTIKQDVNSITTRVGDAEGNISAIDQEVDSIQTTVSNINDTISSLQQHANETDAAITLINTGRFHILYQSYIGVAPDVFEDGNKYSLVPTWDDEQGIFVFNEEFADADGIYYFYSDDHIKYCKVVEGGYEIYTIGNQATSALDSRVTSNEASISELNEFKTETTNSLTNITSKTEENAASISSVASRYYHPLISVDDTAPEMFGDYKYTKEPTWNAATGEYEFDINDRSDTGIYYMADKDNQSYCKVVTTGDGNTLYELYGLVGGSTASIIQKVDDNSSAIGLMVERVENVIDENGNLTDESISSKGSIIISAINGESEAQIDADRIKLTATDSITLALAGLEDKITISDNKINLLVKDGEVSGSVLIDAINGESSAIINAERINLSSYSKTSEVKSLISSGINGISLSVTNNSKSSIIKLMHDGVQIGSSGTIQFAGDVVFKSDLSTANSTTINGANIITGTISADKIDTSSLYTKTVRINSDKSEAIILSSEIGVNNDVSIRLGVDQTHEDSVGLSDTLAYQVYVYGDMIHFKTTDGTGNSLTMRTDLQRISSTGNWDLGTANNPLQYVYVKELRLVDKDGNVGYLYTTNGKKLYWTSESAEDDALLADF